MLELVATLVLSGALADQPHAAPAPAVQARIPVTVPPPVPATSTLTDGPEPPSLQVPHLPGPSSPRSGGRLQLFLDETVGSPSFGARVALGATWSHAIDAPREWERDADGYGKRLGASAAKLASETGIRHLAAAALRLDPREGAERCGCDGVWNRTRFALARAFVTRDARGRLVPDIPLVAGTYGSALLARSWHPRPDYSTADALRTATISLTTHAGLAVLREFGDDLRGLLPFGGKQEPGRQRPDRRDRE